MAVTEKAGHLAWCALTALAFARQDGRVRSPAQENLFITRWLATALKQRRFPREVSPEIEWLLREGRLYGVGANLRGKLDYLFRSCTSPLPEQSDLFRLTYALETAKDMLWTYRLLSDREWSGRNAVTLNAGVNGIYLSKSSLDAAFDDDGGQKAPLMARLTGNVPGLLTLFRRSGWHAEKIQDNACPHQYALNALSRT